MITRPQSVSMRALKAISIGCVVALGFGCRTAAPRIPPVTPEPTGTHQVGKFVWYDLVTHDVAAAKEFYGALFGWQFEDLARENPYSVIRHQGRAIGGIVYLPPATPGVSSSQWIGSLSVSDVDQAVDMVRQQGGTVIRPPENVPDRGRLAIVGDNKGAIVALVRSPTGDPPDREAQSGDWLWTELWTTDIAESAAFYEAVVGYQHGARAVDGLGDYYVMSYGDQPRAGVVKIPWEGVEPGWLTSVAVREADPILRRVDSLGGRVYFAEDRGTLGLAGIVADPTGGVLSIQQWSAEGAGR